MSIKKISIEKCCYETYFFLLEIFKLRILGWTQNNNICIRGNYNFFYETFPGHTVQQQKYY